MLYQPVHMTSRCRPIHNSFASSRSLKIGCTFAFILFYFRVILFYLSYMYDQFNCSIAVICSNCEFICGVQLASMIYVRQKVNPMNPYASNWLERLRRIRQMHERLSAERAKATSTAVHSLTSKPGGDFADFVK